MFDATGNGACSSTRRRRGIGRHGVSSFQSATGVAARPPYRASCEAGTGCEGPAHKAWLRRVDIEGKPLPSLWPPAG